MYGSSLAKMQAAFESTIQRRDTSKVGYTGVFMADENHQSGVKLPLRAPFNQ